MTPRLQQAIRLLQLSTADLAAFVESELAGNPLLERAAEDGPAESGLRDERVVPASGDSASMIGSESLPAADAAPLDRDDGDIWIDESPIDESPPGPVHRAAAEATPGPEDYLPAVPTLNEHVAARIGESFADPGERAMATWLAGHLDAAGYLRCTVAEAAGATGADPETVAAVLERLQGFDPAGLFARDLAECLGLQLRERNRCDPAMQALLDNLDVLAARDWPALRRLCGVDDDDLADMIAEIRALDPRPAAGFEPAPVSPLVADVRMTPAAGGGWAVELNSDALPRLLVNNRYYQTVLNRGGADKAFITGQMQSATWLVKTLHQRATTILKVAAEIVRRQDGFFRHGVMHLRPLTLRDVAETVDLHESTVSRVTANKYIATPRGLYALKYFFTGHVAGGDGHAAESVRHRIGALIGAETDILSDDRIAATLRAEGIDIARRTVAKYREAMGIPSSTHRRRAMPGARTGRP